jgi:hypothetical protein
MVLKIKELTRNRVGPADWLTGREHERTSAA